MRILAIRGSNLASLAGDFAVDFTAEPLVSSGIFAITGPTGAGKSTLLDAVCLALFAEIPRLRAAPASGSVGAQDNGIAARDARSILRHGAGQGHAEVDFAMPGGGHFRARWEVRRARGKADGNLQNHSHTFERLDTGERMGGTNTETRATIAEIIGLTADQFTRAVLLAQGDFEAFIRADANERAALLERLTGSQIYTRIGQRAWTKARELEAGINSLRQQITGQQGLDDEARASAEVTLEEAGLAQAQALVRKEALEAEERRQARGRELLAAVEQAGQALQQACDAHDAALPRREALVRNRKASQLLPLSAAQTAARQDVTLADSHLTERSKAVEAASQSADARIQEAENTAVALAAQEKQARQLAPALEEARSLDRQIAEASTRLEQAQQDVSRTQADATRTSHAAASARDLHDAARARLAAAESWLAAHTALRGLSEREAELTALIAGHAATQADHDAGVTVLAEREEAERKALADHRAQGDGLRLTEEAAQAATAQRQQAEANLPPEGALAEVAARIEAMGGAQLRAFEAAQAVRDAERGAVALETTRQRLQAGHLRLAEIERTLADQTVALAGVDARLIQARRVLAQSLAASTEAAEALRAGLVEGEPCPVCGAAEHPLSALESLLGRHLEENRAQTAALEQEWTGLRGDHQAMLREKEALTQQQATLADEEGDQLSALAGLNAASEDAGASLQQAIDALGIEAGPDLGERLSALRQTANRQRDAMQAAQADVDRTRRAEDAARHALEEARSGEQAARDRLRMRSEAVREARAALATWAATLGREGDVLDHALAAMVDWRSLSDGAAWVRGEARSWRDHAAEQAEAAQALPALAQALGEAGSARDVTAAQARAAAETWRQRNEEAAGLRRKRAALLDGRAVPDVEREIGQATDTARKASETARDRREQAARMLAGEKAAMTEAEGQLTRARATLDQADSTLTEALADSGVMAADLARVASLGAEGLEAEAQALTRIEGAMREAQAVLDKCHEDLARHAVSPAMDESLQGDTLTAALAEVRRELDAMTRALEEARLAIRQDDLVRERTAELRAQLEAESAKAHVWLQLSQLIGDSEGKKFRRFAQGLTLDRLLEQANASLVQLKPRFALERGMGGDMLIQVIDHDMGGRVRGLHNLSGGERFLISLALALGLAAMSTARGVRIESLFIDEGFGALDPSSLGQALALLEHLHATGRRVGVISHVEELKERIAVKIEVKPTGRGTSRIEVNNG